MAKTLLQTALDSPFGDTDTQLRLRPRDTFSPHHALHGERGIRRMSGFPFLALECVTTAGPVAWPWDRALRLGGQCGQGTCRTPRYT